MSTYSHWFIRARLKSRQLLLLVALAEEGNIHRAAQVLNMSQPAASKLLKDLEEVLQVELFERLPRGMRPTRYGESMIRHARMVLANLNQAHDEIASLKDGRFGQVGIGAITAPGLGLLPMAIGQLKQEHPSLKVSLEIDSSPVLLERLLQGRLDIAVARFGATSDKSLFSYESLTEEPVCAVVRPGHPLLETAHLGLRDVVNAAWIVPPDGSILRHRFEVLFQEGGLQPPKNTVETTALLFMTRMLQQSDMLAVVSSEVAHYYAAHGLVAILGLDLACHMDNFGIITSRERLPSPAARAMMRALQTACKAAYGHRLKHDWAN